MKRIFLVGIVFFAMAATHAQEKGLHLILGGEVGQTTFMYDLKDGGYNSGLGFGGYLGAQYFFNRHWGISLAGEFFQFNTHSRYNQKFVFNDQMDNEGDACNLFVELEKSKEYQKTNFVEIPVMLVFQHKFGRIEKHGLYFGLGVKPQIPISSSFNVEGARVYAHYPEWELPLGLPGYSVELPWHGYANNPDRQWEGDNTLKKIGVAAVAEAGFLIGLSRRVDLTLGVSLDYGFLNIKDKADVLLFPVDGKTQQDGQYVAEMINYNGLFNSDKIDVINPMSIRGKAGLRIKIGKLKEREVDTSDRYQYPPQQAGRRIGEPVADTIFVSPVVVYLPAQISEQPYDGPEDGDGTGPGGRGNNRGGGGTGGYTWPNNEPVPPEVEEEIEESIYFDLDKYDLRPESIEVLDRKVALMKKYPQAALSVIGHTCDLGTEGHNDQLSLDRAEAAKMYLIEHGVHPARIIPIPKGEHNPKHKNDSEPNRALNRRVDFILAR